MRIRYHFIANLHITETRSILFLTKCDKDNIIGWAKAHSKTGFSANGWKSTKTLRRLMQNPSCVLWFQVGVNSFQSVEMETSVQLSPASKLTVSPSLVHLQCFRQTAPLRESCVAFREGPQKNGERANLALHFYKVACRLNPGIVF